MSLSSQWSCQQWPFIVQAMTILVLASIALLVTMAIRFIACETSMREMRGSSRSQIALEGLPHHLAPALGHVEDAEDTNLTSKKTCLFTISAFNNYGFVKSFLKRLQKLHPDLLCLVWVVADNIQDWAPNGMKNLTSEILYDVQQSWPFATTWFALTQH